MKKFLPTIVETSNVDSQTPEDKNEQISQINEVWFPCSICQERVDLCSLINHKQCHKANNVLGCTPENNPSNLHILTVQKDKMISQIESSSEYRSREHQKITQSYETLKGKLLSMSPYTGNMYLPSETYCHVYDMQGSLVRSIVICCDKNASWQSCMEDSFTILDNYGQRQNTCFAGIFDGYHGNVAALTAAAEFPILLLDHISAIDPSYKLNEEERFFIRSLDTVFKDDYKETEHLFVTENKKGAEVADVEDIHLAYAKAFWRMDRVLRLGRKESSKLRWSGCSAVTCLIDGYATTDTHKSSDTDRQRLGMLHVANVGNIKAVMCRSGKSRCLTRDHSTANGQEREQVLESEGSISSNESYGLVEGFSRVTKGLGFHGDPQLKKSIIPAPYTISLPIYNTCQFLILASSGLWEVLNTREVVAMVRELLATFLTAPHDVNTGNMATEKDIQLCDLQCNPDTPQHHCASHVRSDGLRNNSQKESKPDNTSKLCNRAAVYVCQQIMKTAMLAGSQQNITVCLILLPGCEIGSHTDRPFA